MNTNSAGIISIGQFQQLQRQLQSSRSRVETGAHGDGRSGKQAATAVADEARNPRDEKLREACSDFQSIFIKQMLDSMRKTVQKQGLLDGGRAEEIFEDMLYDEYAKKMSKTAGLGLDDMIYEQLSQQKPSIPRGSG